MLYYNRVIFFSNDVFQSQQVIINSHCARDPTKHPTHIKSLERRTHYTHMHRDRKSLLISPLLKTSLQSVNPNSATRSHVAHRYLTGLNRDILETRRCGAELRGDHSCPRLRENGGLIEGTNGTSASQTTQQTNATAGKHFAGFVLRFAEALFLSGGCGEMVWLRWDYNQHVADSRG